MNNKKMAFFCNTLSAISIIMICTASLLSAFSAVFVIFSKICSLKLRKLETSL